MAEIPAEADSPLLSTLKDLYYLVVKDPMQPLNQLAEEAILSWNRVLDGQEVVQPRLNELGYAPTAFHFGMEEQPGNRLDDCGIQEGSPGGECFEDALAKRLDDMKSRLDRYFSQTGYRSSSGQCDQMMLELARLSRFVNAWAREGERCPMARPDGRQPAETGRIDLYAIPGPEHRLGKVRRQLALWEPLLNAAIVAWEENLLDNFGRALGEIQQVARMTPAERLEVIPPPGFPLRRRGSARQKISIFEPEQRPLRSRSVFWVRFNQLEERIASGAPVPGAALEALQVDVDHFSRMVETNLFMLASPPGFLHRGRAGVPTIRGRPTTHPFLLDPNGFFKRAVLFQNGTYSRHGGALDSVFLQLRQLERLAKFHQWGDWTRPLRTPVEQAVIAWEENRWDGFTEGLVRVAGIFRRQADEEEV